MVWVRRTRVSLLVALLLVAAALSWLASHPRLYAGQVGRLLTTNLLHEAGATFSCRDLEGNPLSRMVFRQVTVTREGDDGSFLYLTADSLVVGYDLRDTWSRRTHLQEFVAGGVEILLRKGTRSLREEEEEKGAGELPPGLSVDYLALLDLNMRITEADGAPVHEFRGLQLELGAEAASEGVTALLTRAEVEWVNQDVRLYRARGRLRIAHPEYEFTSMFVETDSIRASADLFLRVQDGLDSLRVDGRAETFHLNELLRAIGRDGDAPRLVASGEALVTRGRGDLRIEASGEGFLEDAPIRGEEFVGVLGPDVLTFERIVGQYRSARGTVGGEARIHDSPPSLRLEGVVQGVDASDPWAAGEDLGWPVSDLAGRAALFLTLGDSVSVDLELAELEGMAATLPVSAGNARATWSEADGFELLEAEVVSQGARIQAYGTVRPDRRVALRVTAEIDSLDPWAEEVALPISGGGARVAGILSGTLDSLRLAASGEVARARALGVEADESVIAVRIPRVVKEPGDVEFDLFSPRFLVGDQRLGAVALRMTRKEPFIDVHHFAVARADSDLVAKGRIEELPAGRFAIELDTLGTSWGPDRWHLVEGDAIEVADGLVLTPGLVFESEVGRVAVDGGVRPGGRLDLRLDLREGDIDLLDRLDLIPDVKGGINGRLEFGGTLDSTVFFVDAEVDTLLWPGQEVERARIVARSDGARLEIDTLELSSEDGGGSVDGAILLGRPDWLRESLKGLDALRTVWEAARLQVDMRPRHLDLASWSRPPKPPGSLGLISADLNVTGPTTAPTATGRVTIEELPVPPFRLPLMEAEVSLDRDGLRVEEGRVDVGAGEAKVEGTWPLLVSFTSPPRYLPARGARIQLSTPDDMDLSGLSEVWPDLRRTSGRGSLVVVATGDPRSPELQGLLKIREGEVELRGWSEWVRDLEVDGRFNGKTLRLERIFAREGAKGRIDGSGVVRFDGLRPDDIELDFDAERVLISSVPDLKAVVSGRDLELRLVSPGPGVPRAPRITGSLVCDKAVYTGSFESDPAGEAALGPDISPPWMARLRIRMRDQVRISNALTELRVAGDVTFVRDTQGVALRGDVEIPSGRISIFGTDFRITEGQLDFSRRPVEPEINIRAVTEVPVYDTVGSTGRTLEEIGLEMTGTFADPDLRFTSKSGYDETSILRLLAGFQPTSTSDQNAVEALGVRAGLNVLERALAQEMTGIDTLEIETMGSAVDESGSTRIAFGKYLTESVYLRYAQGFTAGERDILLEYQMSRRTLISGEIKSRVQQAGLEDEFNIDFKWRFRY